jgi:hypothetical protein
MPARNALFVMCALTLPAAAHAGAESALLPLTVRVYDVASVPEPIRAVALSIAAGALDDADIDVTWRKCGGPAASDRCDAMLSFGELVIRIVPLRKMTLGRGALRLGDAMVDPRSGEGTLATIYFDCVQLLAGATGMDVARLLGYAIAHELGHLLLANSTHASTGLMRAVWSDAHLRRAREEDWKFTGREIAAIRARRLAARMVDVSRN